MAPHHSLANGELAISRVIREKCSEALHVLDRFQIVAKMNKALDEVRAEETRRMKREGRDPVLKKSRWLLLKRNCPGAELRE